MMRMIGQWADWNASLNQLHFTRDGGGAFSVATSPSPYNHHNAEDPINFDTDDCQNCTEPALPSWNETAAAYPDYEEDPYVFDKTEVRVVFLVLYTIVFCSCFFGNLMVILVVTMHWRMRSITNFCLANLAFADLCVAIFCVYQNIISYMLDSWVFGEFMCKMYHFIISLSTTASVLILIVICIERYLAIIHPMTCKQMLTLNRLRVTIVFVWILSAAISSPRFYYFSTISMSLRNGKSEVVCLPNRNLYNSQVMDVISMTVLFLIPLGIISVLYTQIGIVLWKSSNTKMPAASASVEESTSSGCYYKETDANLIQTVNLTLLPLQTLDNGKGAASPGTGVTRPTVLHVMGNQNGREDKKSFASKFHCVNCKGKSKRKGQQTRRRVEGGAGVKGQCSRRANCHKSFDAGNRGGHVCCHQGHHHCFTAPNGPTDEVGYAQTNGCCDGVEPVPGNEGCDGKVDQDKDHNSPITSTCCGGKRCLNPLRKQGLGEKSVSFSTPPSPYCKHTCSCLDGSSKTDPIVLVKFEKSKNSSNKKGKRGHCTILMNESNILSATRSPNSNAANGNVATEGEESSDTASISPPHGCNGCPAQKRMDQLAPGNCIQTSGRSTPHICPGSADSRRNFSFDQNVDLEAGCEDTHHIQHTCCCCELQSCNLCPSPKVVGPHYPQAAPSTTKRLRRMRIVKSFKYGSGALQSRRRIIRMLIIVVLAFALCHLPFHARKVWQHWSPSWAPFDANSTFSTFFTPITFLVMYANSGINPILYAFMSKKFRMSFRDLLCCKMRHSLRISRNASVRSTHAVALSQTGC